MVKRWALRLILAFFLIILSGTAFYFVHPDVSELAIKNPETTAFMEYRKKEWQRQNKNKRIVRYWVGISQISPYVVKAVVIAEDDKFWSHEGFDYEAIKKALEKDIKLGKFKFGASTISQQLAKNLYLSPSKNPIRKLKEAILTWRLERHLSKKRILEIYLNIAEWGDGLFGIEAAARHYYGKPASQLSAREASRLASVLPNPRRYNPEGSGRYVSYRAELIYSIMVRRGLVIEGYDEIIGEQTGLDNRNMPGHEAPADFDPAKPPAAQVEDRLPQKPKPSPDHAEEKN